MNIQDIQDQIYQFVETQGNRFVTPAGLNVLELPWRDDLNSQRVIFSWTDGQLVTITLVTGVSENAMIHGEMVTQYISDAQLISTAQWFGFMAGWE